MYDELREVLEKKYGKECVEDERKKLFEDLWPFMDVTYGIAVYQEQLMRLVQAMAWFSLAEADMLRRWVWKKKKDVIEKIRHEFIEKAQTFREYKKETSDYIYEKMIMPASDYSFNKSHAACYAFIAYQTAFLKAYYPTEFLTSLLTSDEEDLDRIGMEVEEVKSKWINLLPPSVQASFEHFTYIDDDNIRFGLTAIKWLGEASVEKIIEVRKSLPSKKFESLEEFVSLCGKEVANKKALESLIKAWALDELAPRDALIDNIEEITRFGRAKEEKKTSSQIGLFDAMGTMMESEQLIINAKRAHSFEEMLFAEKEVLGFMVSGHPLDGLKKYIAERSANTKYLRLPIEKTQSMIDEIADEKKKKALKDDIKKPCKAFGLVLDVRKIFTKTGKNMMILQCEGIDYNFEVTIFDRDYEKFNNKVKVADIVIPEGPVSIDSAFGRKSVQAREMKIMSVTQVRDQAKAMKMMDEGKRILFQLTQEEKAALPTAPLVVEKTVVEVLPEEGNDEDSILEIPAEGYTYSSTPIESNMEVKSEEIEGTPILNIDEVLPSEKKEYVVEVTPSMKKEDRSAFNFITFNFHIWLYGCWWIGIPSCRYF